MNDIVIVALWGGYCALHSILISITVTQWVSRHLKEYYAFYRLFYVVVSFVLLVPLIRFTSELEGADVFTYASPLAVIRSALLIGSLVLFFWAFFFDYDALSFFGIRQILNFRNVKKTEEPQGLKKNGLLGIIRHPMYLMLLIYLWCQIDNMIDLEVTIVLTIYVIIGTKLEEKKLMLEFGELYAAYQHEVPMLVPSVNLLKKKIE
jgi:protein-S-isoprenylcysteine O-methyltransferase Ste14